MNLLARMRPARAGERRPWLRRSSRRRPQAAPRPDLPAPPELPKRRITFSYALIAALAWTIGAAIAYHSLGWYPLTTAKVFFLSAWVPFVVLGMILNAMSEPAERRIVASLLTAVTFFAPSLAANQLPGVTQPEEFPLPGGTAIAVDAHPDGRWNLYLMQGDAAHLTKLTTSPIAESLPALSPEGRHIAYVDDSEGSDDLWIMDLDASGHPTGAHRITSGSLDEAEPRWSPDGTRIVYEEIDSSDPAHTRSNVVVVSSRGGESNPLTSDGRSWEPDWSPDGSQIAFSHSVNAAVDDYGIWIMRADGSAMEVVTNSRGDEYGPRWSPDGSRILYTTDAAGDQDVFVLDLGDTGAITNLTPNSADQDFSIGWTLDGHPIFASDRSHTGGTFLYFMDPDGSDVRLALRI